jgi:hypothetical protein
MRLMVDTWPDNRLHTIFAGIAVTDFTSDMLNYRFCSPPRGEWELYKTNGFSFVIADRPLLILYKESS